MNTEVVLINGVRYVPATKAVPGMEDILRTLALQYHTPETLEEFGTKGLRITVGEDEDPDTSETFDEFAARLREQMGERG